MRKGEENGVSVTRLYKYSLDISQVSFAVLLLSGKLGSSWKLREESAQRFTPRSVSSRCYDNDTT